MKDPSQMDEKQTREEMIDRQLRHVGWISRYLKLEVNSVKSDFPNKQYILSEGPGDKSGRFIDYLLLAEDNSPLAFIEAKKFSQSEENGRAQARTYRDDIKKQIKETLPYFLTNGHKWLLTDQDGVERHVSGPFSQSDLSRRSEMYKSRTDPTKVNYGKIVTRPRNIIIVREILEHFQQGHRAALVCMATGTGKTRVAMAVIKALLDANIVRNALFVTDRTELTNQAKSAG